MKHANPCLWTCLTLLATGCMVGPDFQAPTAEAPADFAQWHGGSSELLEQRSTSTAPVPQWAQLRDPALEQLLTQAADANADVQTAVLRLAESRALRQSAGAGLAPQVNADAGVNRIRLSERGDSTRMVSILLPPEQQEEVVSALAQPYDSERIGLDFSWELDLWGRVRRGIEAADAQMAASQALLTQARWSVQAEVARHYFELRGIQRQIALTNDDVAAAEESLDLVRALADGGLTTDLDVTRQQALLSDLRARQPQLLAQEAAAINALTLLLAQPPGALQTLLAPHEDPSADAWPDLSLGLPSDIARRRPDIARAEAQLHAATAATGVATADFYPRLTLGASAGFQALSTESFGDWGNRTWSLGPGLQLPIFDNGRRNATLTLRQLQQQEAAIAYHQTVLQAWHEIDNALNAYSAQRVRNVHLIEKERSSRDALALAKANYESGLTNFLTELDAQRTFIAAQRERADNDAQLGLAWTAVIKALGPARGE
jgi:NodT family efflux transporter outer membrane factor (OMF) lipoprotein